jgi:subtilisin family serine protease
LIGAGLGSVLSALLLLAGLIGFTTPAAAEELLVKLVAGLTADQQAAVIARNGGTEVSQIPALRLHVVSVPAEQLNTALENYRADAEVARVELNQTRQAEGAEGEPPPLWHLPQIGWDQVTATPTGSATVAVLDTGVDANHPDLQGQVLLSGASFVAGASATVDLNGHGTWLAGIIAAADRGATAGVCSQGVNILPVTVLGADATGQDSHIIAGVLYAVEQRADVILMAFSNPGKSASLQEANDYAWEQGAVVVAATGNGNPGTADPTFPAGDRGVMGVSATDENDALWLGSNYGLATFIAAPGVSIDTLDTDGGYTSVTGTSTSAAIVAGVAGCLKAVDPSLSNGEIVGRLAGTANRTVTTDLETGNGRVDMAAALAYTGEDQFVQPAGVDGGGGPVVEPYVAAAVNVKTISVGYQAGTLSAGTPGSVTYTVTATAEGNNQQSSFTPTVTTSLPTGATWSFSPSTMTCSSDGGSPPALSCTPSILTITTTAATPAGVTTFTVQAGASETPTGTGKLTVGAPANTAPVLGAIGNKTVDEETVLSFTATATDGDTPAQTLTFSLVGAPAGASITAGGAFSWTPTEAQGPGDYLFTVKVCDNGTTPLCDDEVITVTVNEVNKAPVLDPIGNKTVDEETELSFTATASDPDTGTGAANTLTFSLVGAPAGASINGSTGAFTWTPTEAQGPGDYPFTVKVCDNGTPSLCDEEAITVTVNEVNKAPVLDAIGNKTVNEGSLLSFTATATDDDIPANTLTFSLVDQPVGASIIDSTGVFSWTPADNGSATFTVKVCDNGVPVLCDKETFTVTVLNVPPLSHNRPSRPRLSTAG